MPKIRGRFENLPAMIQDFINRVCAQSGERRFRPQDFVEFDTDQMDHNARNKMPIQLWSQRHAHQVVSSILDATGKPIIKSSNMDEPEVSSIPVNRLKK